MCRACSQNGNSAELAELTGQEKQHLNNSKHSTEVTLADPEGGARGPWSPHGLSIVNVYRCSNNDGFLTNSTFWIWRQAAFWAIFS